MAGPADCYSEPLLSVDEAIERLLASSAGITETETVAVIDALGRVLAEDIVSGINVPGYDNSAMDGYAVLSADCAQPGAVLRVTQRIPAGSTGSELEAGCTARIFTGAPVPPGADAVVMQERCTRQADSDVVSINARVAAGDNIRRAGEDIAQGSVILHAGTRLRPQELGLIASVGIGTVEVVRKLRVACFFTGDELVTPGEALQAGQIYNSNRYTLNGFLQSQGCEITDYGIVPDSLEATLEVIEQAAATADMIVTSGGVSVGEEDYVRLALEQLGRLELWRIAMKPGKPVAFGKVGNALFMGLPGNPVSVFVTAQLFARPVIRKLQGETQCLQQPIAVRAGFDWPATKRSEFLRARIEQRGAESWAVIYSQQGSGVLSSASWADGLAIVISGTAIQQGELINFLAFD
ncbi:MAG: gephyrin-like molybdotransferase Glp [Gammaproteobacteria bacterium]